MSATTSAFLDFLRIICALVVFSSHCAQHWNDQASAVIRPYAHHAVVVFFVLSGYVISHATFGRRGIGVEHYAVSRISRLYSVVIPALLLTALLQWVGVNLAPEAYAQASRGADVARYALAAVFMQNAWFLSSAPPTNAPLWSLSYEAWYYAGFGAALFAPSYTRKVMLVGLVCLVAGPNIVLLAPAWLLGVALYAIGQRKRILAMPTSLWLMAGMVFMAAAHTAFSELPYPIGSPRFYFSASFVSDFIFAIGVALMIVGTNCSDVKVSEAISKNLRTAGDYTFPVYLFHFPVIFFWTAISGGGPTSWFDAVLTALLILFAVLFISAFSERLRPWWKRLVQRAWAGLQTMFSLRWGGGNLG